MSKRTEWDIVEEIYEEAKRELPHNPYLLTRIRCKEIEYSRQIKRKYQGSKRYKRIKF